jgi:hypothetical protein
LVYSSFILMCLLMHFLFSCFDNLRKIFCLGRTWWRLCQKRVVCRLVDILVFIDKPIKQYRKVNSPQENSFIQIFRIKRKEMFFGWLHL